MEDVGVDSIIFFPQGKYTFQGNWCQRYHEGVVTRTHTDAQGNVLIDGHHTKGENDGKYTEYRGYEYQFHDIPLQEVRIAPSALDTMI